MITLNPQIVAAQLPAFFSRRKLDPAVIAEYILARGRFQETWLIAVLDTHRMNKLESYNSPDLLHHLSTDLGGAPVLLSNTSGLRYGILIAGRPSLPAQIEMPSGRSGFQIGQNIRGEQIFIPTFEALGHVTIGGMTGSGKSNCIRLLLNQAVDMGAALLLIDPDEQSFGEYEDHPALLAPIASMADAEKIIQRAILEKYTRAQAYKNLRATLKRPRIENLDEYNRLAQTANTRPIPRLLVVVDEVNTLITRLGGPRSEFAASLFELVTGGRKFGIHVVMAGQDFRRETTGALISQSRTVLCFQVKEPSTSKVVLGSEGAERLRTPGRAITSQWGLLQTYAAPQMSIMPEDIKPAYSPVTPAQVAAAARTEIEEMAEQIIAANAHTWNSKRRIAATLFNREYAGAYCRKLDQALELAQSMVSATTTPAEALQNGPTAAFSQS